MQNFYVVIKKDCLTLYEKNGNTFEKVYLGGNPEYAYSVNSAKEHTEKFMAMIQEEYNLDSVGEVEFVVIDNEDEIVSDVMLKAFGKSVKEKIEIDKLMLDVSDALRRDKKMHISEYGINFDGKKYAVSNRKISKEEFSLLAYTLTDDVLMKYVR